MFRDLFPGGSFIFVKRDLVDVVRSKIYAFVKEDIWSSFSAEQQDDKISNLINQVLRDYNVYRSFSERYPDGCHVIQYEDLLKDPEVIVGRLLDDLDLDRDGYDWERLKSVMNTVLTSTKRDEELSDRIRNLSRTAL